jgi:uncharacterized membrane protein YtjA (UPF0391 family)
MSQARRGSAGNFFRVLLVAAADVAAMPQHARLAKKLHLQWRRPARGHQAQRPDREEKDMLYYALVFLLIAILAGFFGFGGIAIVSAGIAKILFFVFIVLFLVSLITHVSRRI